MTYLQIKHLEVARYWNKPALRAVFLEQIKKGQIELL